MSLKQLYCNDSQVANKEINVFVGGQCLFARFLCKETGGESLKRILVVDDAAFMRMTLKSILERNGFQVIGEAENGAMGIRKFCELQPDIVMMDITMPEMDGTEALKEIIRIDPNSKVIMVSAIIGQESYVRQCVRLGAKSFIVKPFKEDQVVKTLTQFV